MLKLSETKYYDTEHQTLYSYMESGAGGTPEISIDKPEEPEEGGLVIRGAPAVALWAWVTLERNLVAL